MQDGLRFAVIEPEPPAGGFLWDLMEQLWFTGAAPASHLQHRLGIEAAFISYDSCFPERLLASAWPRSAVCIPLPNRCCLVDAGEEILMRTDTVQKYVRGRLGLEGI